MEEKITIETIDKLADLSKLSFNDEEKQVLLGQVNDIITMLKDCDDVTVTDSENVRTQRLRDLRDDEVVESMDISDALRNAPNAHNGYFVVPKVVD